MTTPRHPGLRPLLLGVLLTLGATTPPVLQAAAVEPGEEGISGALATGIAPPRRAPARGEEARGPFDRLLIRNAMVIAGNGAPPVGPVDIEIHGDRIARIHGGHQAAVPDDAEVLDVLTDPEYVLKLWLAHGVTTVRDVGAVMGLDWTVEHRERAAAGEISAPRLRVHAMFPPATASADEARAWVKAVRRKGADGIKFRGARAEPFAAAMEEAQRLGMKTSYHHAQLSVVQTNVLDSARLGLDSMEHWYGLPEAMFEDRVIQDYPLDYNYANEQDRFGEAGRLWLQAAAPGSDTWNNTIAELVDLDFTLSPTFTIYEANRDLMRARNADWMDDYVPPYMARAFEANPDIHGSYFFDWTTAHEIAWKQNYQRWMAFVNDYKNAGGRVVAGSDAGFIYKVYGFAYIRELELLQEAGFHPLEVVKAATLDGAELLGYTIRDGIVFDAPKMLEQVRAIVARDWAAEAE